MLDTQLLRRWPALLALAAAVLASVAPAVAATRTFYFTGTATNGDFAGVPINTAFSGTYTVDDAATDTNVDAAVGDYATGAFSIGLDGIGTMDFGTSATTSVRNDIPMFFPGFFSDSLSIFASESARAVPFTNVTNSADLSFQTGIFGTPTTLTGDSLTAAIAVPFGSWGDPGAVVINFSAAGSHACPPFTTNCNVVLTMDFLGEAFTLTVLKDGTGFGDVVSVPPGIDCGATCAADLAGSVDLTATPQSGSVFTAWTGCDSVLDNVCTVDVTSQRTVTATFDEEPPPETETIPTLSAPILAVLAALLGGLALLVLRRPPGAG